MSTSMSDSRKESKRCLIRSVRRAEEREWKRKRCKKLLRMFLTLSLARSEV